MPAIIAVTAAYQIFGLELRLPVPQHWLTNAIVSAINDQLNDRRLTAYITLAAGAFAYWMGRENFLHTTKEALRMGIKTFIRNIQQEIADDIRAETRAEVKAETREEVASEVRAEVASEVRAKTLDELRAMPPHKVLALLGHHEVDPESEHSDNGKSPQD